jgi:ABC-type transporter Mla MlaB component
MLRITLLTGADSAQTIKLEGTLLGPWVDEVREACAGAMARPGRTRLDLTAVPFVDTAGVALLRELISRGVEIAGCSGYVAELIHRADT